jgi:hypothetical protein
MINNISEYVRVYMLLHLHKVGRIRTYNLQIFRSSKYHTQFVCPQIEFQLVNWAKKKEDNFWQEEPHSSKLLLTELVLDPNPSHFNSVHILRIHINKINCTAHSLSSCCIVATRPRNMHSDSVSHILFQLHHKCLQVTNLTIVESFKQPRNYLFSIKFVQNLYRRAVTYADILLSRDYGRD